MKCLLNGKDRLMCPYGHLTIVTAQEGDPCRHTPLLRLTGSQDRIIWESVLKGLEENSLSENVTADTCDFGAVVSSAGKYVVFAGNTRTLSVDLNSGAVLDASDVSQTNSSLDVLALYEFSIGISVMISAKTIVVFGGNGSVRLTKSLSAPIASIIEVNQKGVKYSRYDIDNPDLAEREEYVSFEA